MPDIEVEDVLTVDQRIALMDIYFRELEHRSNTLWSQASRFFVATITIILLPNLSAGLGLQLPALPEYLFRAVGLFMALLFMYITWTYSKKVQASGKTYRRMMASLPQEYRRVSIKTLPRGRLAVERTSYWVCLVMFLALIITAVVFLVVG